MSDGARVVAGAATSDRSGAAASKAHGGYERAKDSRAAASLLLLRDREGGGGLEVLMLRRAERDGDLRSGAAVFPGGVLDARDRLAQAHSHGRSDAEASARLGLDEGGLDYEIAALRECFEEAGLLLATEPIDAGRAAALHPWRQRLNDGEASAAEFCAAEKLTFDLSGLVYFSHWLTPPGVPKRFDTRFFAVAAPLGQTATADGGEAVELMWLTPAEALDPSRKLVLLPVTRRTLTELSRSATAAAALAAAREREARGDIRLTMPRRATSAKGPKIVLPDELPYAEVAKLDAEGRGDAFADLVPGRVVRLAEHVFRITAPNPGPMTGPGTNSYLVGAGDRWTVIDPGPPIDEHVQALIDAVKAMSPAARIERILVTHTHRDHSPAAALLSKATGAPVFGRRAAFPEWQDDSVAFAHQPTHGDRIDVAPGATLRAIHTPGHASNHLCWLLEHEQLLFTGDHVMQGSTVVINPPDGDMGAYLRALNALLDEDLRWLAPGHGFLVAEPHAVLRGLIAHRLKREAKVSAALARMKGPAGIDELLPSVYDDVNPALHAMARRSLLAHLLKLESDGSVRREGERWVS